MPRGVLDALRTIFGRLANVSGSSGGLKGRGFRHRLATAAGREDAMRRTTTRLPLLRHASPTTAAEDAWNQWQRELQEDLCDVLLLDFDAEEEDIHPRMDRKVSRLTFFQEEIQTVLEHLAAEVAEIHADRDLAQWTELQYAAIQASLRRPARGRHYGDIMDSARVQKPSYDGRVP